MSDPTTQDAKANLEKHLTSLIGQPLREYIDKYKPDYIGISLDYDKIDVSILNGKRQYLITNLQLKLTII